jgi:hypothetical protein
VHRLSMTMKEREIIKLLTDELNKSGLWWWVAHKSPYYPQPDIFGLFDVIYLNNHERKREIPTVHFIQATTLSNLSHRRRKIKELFREKGFLVPGGVQVWAYDRKNKCFRKETINNDMVY